VYFIDAEQYLNMRRETPHATSFSLQDPEGPPRHLGKKSHPGITLQEFGRCLPWIPCDDRIFLIAEGGFSSNLLNQVKHLDTSRTLYLVRDIPGSRSRSTVMEKFLA
jgi:hypothetical protein